MNQVHRLVSHLIPLCMMIAVLLLATFGMACTSGQDAPDPNTAGSGLKVAFMTANCGSSRSMTAMKPALPLPTHNV